MGKNYSIKILLKYYLNFVEIYEESLIIVKLNKIEEIREKVDLYIKSLNEDIDEENTIELVSIIDYYEIENRISVEDSFIDIYSRYLNKEEVELCML